MSNKRAVEQLQLKPAQPALSSFDSSLLNGANGFRVAGPTGFNLLGSSVSTAGDLNGDGLDDLVLVAQGASGFAGAVYILFGKANQGTSLANREDNKLKTIAQNVARVARNKITYSPTFFGYSEIRIDDLINKITDIVQEVIRTRAATNATNIPMKTF